MNINTDGENRSSQMKLQSPSRAQYSRSRPPTPSTELLIYCRKEDALHVHFVLAPFRRRRPTICIRRRFHSLHRHYSR